MEIVFRTDASLQIGTGHVMRCLTLADALKAGGAKCRFICREHPGNLLAQIRQRGYIAQCLPVATGIVANDLTEVASPSHADWLGADWAIDANQTREAIGETGADWLIVDHYALDARWEQALRSSCRKIMVIDDLADRPHDCDLLLDQNLGRLREDYRQLVTTGCAVLTGPRYALLRPEFAAMREYSLRRRANPQLKCLLITMGGVDQADATSQVLEALRQVSMLPPDCRIVVVMGQHAPWLERVRTIAAKMPWLTEVRVNVSDMAQVMADSDLAIGAAGSTSWERCCLGLPSLIGVLAENQQPIANALQFAGVARVFSPKAGVPALLQLIRTLLADISVITRMSITAAGITDGLGVTRVASHLTVLVPA